LTQTLTQTFRAVGWVVAGQLTQFLAQPFKERAGRAQPNFLLEDKLFPDMGRIIMIYEVRCHGAEF